MATATPPFKVKAIYEYISDHPDDLSFPISQLITVTAEEDEEWFSGRYFDNVGALREGMFPKNFVEIVVEDESPAIPSHPSRSHRSQVPPPQSPSSLTREATIAEPEPEIHEKSDEGIRTAMAGSPQAQKPVQVQSSSAMSAAASSPVPISSNTEPKPDLARSEAKSSFRDRIAAFNIANAAPIGPQSKPAVQSFVKKPFVAPAPSAYIPPAPQNVSKATGVPYEQSASPRTSIDDDRVSSEEPHGSHEPIIPGGTSLKDRIALLQQMQLEQQAAQAAKAAKKKKTHKKQPSQQLPDQPEETTIAGAETTVNELHPFSDELEASPTSESIAQFAQPEVTATLGSYTNTAGPTPTASQGVDLDEESAGDQSDVEDNIEASSLPVSPQMRVQEPGSELVGEADDEQAQDIDEDEADEEEEIDPEVARRIAIRERMAKMSGGMGMPFAIPGVMGMPMGPFPKSTTKKVPEQPKSSVEEVYSQPKPIPILPMAGPPPTNLESQQDEEDVEEELESEQEPGSQMAPTEAEADTLRKETIAETHTHRVSADLKRHGDDTIVSTGVSDVPGVVPIEPSNPLYAPAVIEDDAIEEESSEESSDEVEESATITNHGGLPVQPPIPQSRVIPTPNNTLEYASNASVGGSQPPPVPPVPPTPSASHPSRHQLPPPPPPPAAPASYAPPPVPPPVPSVPPIPPAHSVPVRRSTDISERSLPRKSAEYVSSDNDDTTTGYEADNDTDLNVSSTLEIDSADTQYPNHMTTNEPPSAPPPSIPPSHAAPPPPRSYTLPPPPPPPSHFVPHPMSFATVSPPVPASPVSPSSYSDRRHSIEGRLSMDRRGSAEVRRSFDRSRPSMDVVSSGAYMASDIDLSEKSAWWSAPESVPPSLLNRSRDLTVEVDEKLHSRRGRGIITRVIYVLYYDYSQSVITIQFDRENPSNVKFEQRHEPPPPPLRRDQLEDAYTRFGAKIRNFAIDNLGKNVGDGSAFGFVRAAVAQLPDALQSAGTRSYGAVVYSNLANASVTQVDEIKPGDIISFRNGKFQGHKGGLHQKYSLEVGKPDHCAIVQEWDGTKKKVKVLEQPNEKGRVRAESYRLGDLKSGEVIVFRVVGRDYIGWVGDEF
ncbi:hypothetical protein V1509DRAFT_618500 [Lipomyces kononenkoae]